LKGGLVDSQSDPTLRSGGLLTIKRNSPPAKSSVRSVGRRMQPACHSEECNIQRLALLEQQTSCGWNELGRPYLALTTFKGMP
jgi:hypothetical protein